MLQADSGVITLADISEVIDERLHRRIVFVVNVDDLLITERTLLLTWVSAVLLLASLAWRSFSVT